MSDEATPEPHALLARIAGVHQVVLTYLLDDAARRMEAANEPEQLAAIQHLRDTLAELQEAPA
jgi:hypothetical protein